MTDPTPSNGQPPATAMTAPAPRPLIELPETDGGAINAFASEAHFVSAQRMATALAKSSLVPESYRDNVPNVLIAMELASRIGASIFAVMQSLNIVHGRPGWAATFLIATVNGSRKFSPMRYRFEGSPGDDGWGCRAWAKDRETGEECVGSLVTMALAKAEGWHGKNGSKWKTMPEQMLMYRAAAFWARVYSPEMALGMHTAEELQDIDGPAPTTRAGRVVAGEALTGAIDAVLDAVPVAAESKPAKEPPKKRQSKHDNEAPAMSVADRAAELKTALLNAKGDDLPPIAKAAQAFADDPANGEEGVLMARFIGSYAP